MDLCPRRHTSHRRGLSRGTNIKTRVDACTLGLENLGIRSSYWPTTVGDSRVPLCGDCRLDGGSGAVGGGGDFGSLTAAIGPLLEEPSLGCEFVLNLGVCLRLLSTLLVFAIFFGGVGVRRAGGRLRLPFVKVSASSSESSAELAAAKSSEESEESGSTPSKRLLLSIALVL